MGSKKGTKTGPWHRFEETKRQKKKPIPVYITQKKKLLNELGIVLTEEETTHIDSLTSEILIDAFVRSILQGNRIGDPETKEWKYESYLVEKRGRKRKKISRN